MKSCTLVSRAVSKKSERKAESAEKRKKKEHLIDGNRFTKVVNTQRTRVQH